MGERTYKYIVSDSSGVKIGEFYDMGHLFMFLEGLNDAEFLEPNWNYVVKRELIHNESETVEDLEYVDMEEL